MMGFQRILLLLSAGTLLLGTFFGVEGGVVPSRFHERSPIKETDNSQAGLRVTEEVPSEVADDDWINAVPSAAVSRNKREAFLSVQPGFNLNTGVSLDPLGSGGIGQRVFGTGTTISERGWTGCLFGTCLTIG